MRNTKDPRPETFHLADTTDIQQVGRMETVDNWRERRDLMLKKAKVYDRLEPLIDAAHANQLSLAVFKPTKILDFVWESDDREWDQSKVDAMRSNADQAELFEGDTWRQTFKLMPKLPFKFSYRFEDADGKQSEMQVLDWETGQLFWNCRRAADGDERVALTKVREKYMDQFLKTDLHFFLGTTKEFHSWATNPFLIIGVFPIPHEITGELFNSGDLLSSKGARILRVDLETINAELVRYLARHPEKMHSLQPRKFEELVAELFRDQGYEVELTRFSKDGGFDIRVVRKSAVGLGLTLIECKRYSQGNPVGVELVRGLHSVVETANATSGLLVTTSYFTKGARALQDTYKHRLDLADFERLQGMLKSYKGQLL